MDLKTKTKTNRCQSIVKASIFLTFLLPYTASLAGTITSTTDTSELLNSLTGESNTGSNAYYIGSDLAVGTFTNSPNQFPLPSGIVLSTGNVQDYSGSTNTSGNKTSNLNTDGYAPLTELAGVPTNDAARFGFDFQSTSNKVSFDFVFGSEEYPEYVGSSFNDAFGIYITDQENGNTIQVAKDNSGQPITINSSFMQDGSDGELDGTTGKLHVDVNLTAGKNYSIEFAIADGSDSSYDSTAFISQLEGITEISDPVEIRGLFVGSDEFILHGDSTFGGLKGGDAAQRIRDAFANLGNASKEDNALEVLKGTYLKSKDQDGNTIKEGGQIASTILSKLDSSLSLVDDNDIFVFSLSGHGGVAGENNGIRVGANDQTGWIEDYLLKDVLDNHPEVQKWVILDGCYSGGFWDELQEVPNVTFLSSVAGDKLSNYYRATGKSMFSNGVVEALTEDIDTIDLNGNGIIDLYEIETFLINYEPLLGILNSTTEHYDKYDEEIFAYSRYAPSDDPLLEYDPLKIGNFIVQSNSESKILGSINQSISSNLNAVNVPEPSTLVIMLVGLMALLRTDKQAR